MIFRYYHTLPEEAVSIRKKVFCMEQGFQNEFDAIDQIAEHLILWDCETPVGTCRLYQKPQTHDYIIGRIAIVKEYRGKKMGSKILREAENRIDQRGGNCVFLHAQVRAKPFYQKQGYAALEDTDSVEGCPHIWMYKRIGE